MRELGPHPTIWPGPRHTFVPSGILIHTTVWPQYANVADRQTGQTIPLGEPFYKRSPKNIDLFRYRCLMFISLCLLTCSKFLPSSCTVGQLYERIDVLCERCSEKTQRRRPKKTIQYTHHVKTKKWYWFIYYSHLYTASIISKGSLFADPAIWSISPERKTPNKNWKISNVSITRFICICIRNLLTVTLEF